MSGGIEGVAGAAEGALVADAATGELKPGRGKRQVGDACANCGAKLEGPHCHACGQVADDLHRPFWALVKDALEGLFAIDGRFLKTVPALLFRPGRVSKSYLDGARARYVQPFRLYLVAAVVFLLAVSTVTGDWTDIDFDGPPRTAAELADAERSLADQAEAARSRGDPSAAGLEAASEGLARAREAAEEEEAAIGEEPDIDPVIERARRREDMKCEFRRGLLPEELGACPAEDEDDTDFDSDFGEDIKTWPIEVRRFLMHQTEVVIDNPNRFLESVNSWISRTLIGLFPVYALLLALMNFWKRRFFFYDHLIVSLHFHSFLFLMMTLLIIASPVVGWPWLCAVFFLWSNFYLYKVHRVVYGSGRFTSVLRTLVLDFFYLILLSFTPALLAITGFLTA